jgi:hypothetical protein
MAARPTLSFSRILTVIAAAALFAGGCGRSSLLPFDLGVPPQILTAATGAGVIDGRARFREVWCAIRDAHGRSLPDDRPCEDALVRFDGEGPPTGRPVIIEPAPGTLRIAVVPGLLGDCLKSTVVPFSDGLAHLEAQGYRGEVVWVSGRSSTGHNARQLRDALMAMDLAPGERLLVVAYSKGAVDTLEALVAYPEIVPRVAAVVSVAGAVNGSPLVEGFLNKYGDVLKWLPLPGCNGGDGGALESLRPGTRMRFLSSAPLPARVPYFSLAGVVDRDEISWPLRLRWQRLSAIDPRNDGQLLWTDAVIPGSTLLGYVRADHLAIALPLARKRVSVGAALVDHNAFPREVMLEAILRTVEERLRGGAASAPAAPAAGAVDGGPPCPQPAPRPARGHASASAAGGDARHGEAGCHPLLEGAR